MATRTEGRFLLLAVAWCLAAATAAAKPPTRVNVTVSDAIDLNTQGWAEVTAVAFGPGEHPSCPSGRLFFAKGKSVLATSLDGNREPITPNPWSAPIDETTDPYIIFDNHLVKAKDGALLMTFEGGTWNDNLSPRPSWWNWTIEFPAKGRSEPGARAAIWVYRSTDCGATWSPLPPIDAARLEVPHPVSGEPVVGLCGTPRRRVKDGEKKAALGGWDGHFAYADPHSGHVFLATPCAYGTDTIDEERSRGLLLRSTDTGASWRVIGHGDGKVWRAPLASHPDRVAFVYARGPSIRAVTFPASAPSVELLNGSHEVRHLTGRDGNKTTATQVNTNIWRLRAVTPSANGFLVSVPVYLAGALGHVVYEVDKSGANPREVDTIRAPRSGGERGDTVHATFVPGVADDSRRFSLFYWIQSRDASANSSFAVKFQVYADDRPLLELPGVLTIENGVAYRYPFEDGGSRFVGDYMGGCAYRGADGARHFVATWSEGGRLHFNTVSVTFNGPPGPEPPVKTLAQVRPAGRPPLAPPLPLERLEAPVPIDPDR
jgi:hypothetical protein